jgi:hypothetical protein
VLVVGDIDPRYTCHAVTLSFKVELLKVENYNTQSQPAQLTLTLLMTWLNTDHPHHAFTNHDFAVTADFFHRCLNSHVALLYYFARNTMRALLKS